MKFELVALSAFAAFAVAVPVNKRQDNMAFSTTTEIVIDTVYSTTTLWVPSGSALNNNGIVTPSSQPSSSSATPPAALTTSSSSPPPPPPPSTSYVPPAPTTSNDPPPPTTTAAPYVAPTPPANPAPQAAPPSTPSSSGSGSTQGQFVGDITFYDVTVGLTSCGKSFQNTDLVVALAPGVMQNGANPNSNPNCGRTINIYYGGNVHQGVVWDTCEGCAGDSIDLTPSLFKQVAPQGDGRVSGVGWSFA